LLIQIVNNNKKIESRAVLDDGVKELKEEPTSFSNLFGKGEEIGKKKIIENSGNVSHYSNLSRKIFTAAVIVFWFLAYNTVQTCRDYQLQNHVVSQRTISRSEVNSCNYRFWK
jgi:hypothetical protein